MEQNSTETIIITEAENPAPKKDILGIVSMILGILGHCLLWSGSGFALLCLPFGAAAIALSIISKVKNHRFSGYAIAGLVAGIIGVLISVVLMVNIIRIIYYILSGISTDISSIVSSV